MSATKGTVTYGSGTADDPWILKTPSLTSDYKAWRDDSQSPPALVVQVGTTVLSYRLACLDDLTAMLRAHGDWMPLGNADEGKPVQPGLIPSLEESMRQRTILVGSVEEVAAQVQELKDLLGVEYLTLFPHLVGDPYSKAVEQMDRFANEVMPLVS